jgi:probable phosphoglycerate mutase
MQVRMISALHQLARRHAGDAIVVVSHADPIKAAVAHAVGAHLDHFQRIVISPCSVSAVLLGAGAPVALCVNEVGGDLRRLRPS